MDPTEEIKNKLKVLFMPLKGALSKPLGVYAKNDNVYMVFGQQEDAHELLPVKSSDGFDFELENGAITPSTEKALNIAQMNYFTNGKANHFVIKCVSDASQSTSYIAELKQHSLTDFQSIGFETRNAAIVPDYRHDNNFVMYYGDRSINIAYSKDLSTWESRGAILHEAFPVMVGNVFNLKEGNLLVYFGTTIVDDIVYHRAYLALFDANDPTKLLWKSDKPIWDQKDQWPGMPATHIGTCHFHDHLISYWHVNNEIMYGVLIADAFTDILAQHTAKNHTKLTKHEANPILAPNISNDWEAFNTFNPAALYTAGKVHILYRAQGYDYISSIGYASSDNGIFIDERSDKPIFAHAINSKGDFTVNYDFVSGGGFGGCEDPRITQIGDKVYMVYVAFDGMTPPRLALTSIHIDDFLNKHWLWAKPVLISPPDVVDKSGCILPEKINGKYVVFHRIFPDILIDFVDDLNFDGKTNFLKGEYKIKIRPDMWDSRKIGAGAPPIKTKDGWLLIYYGVDDKNASKYHIGAMLLDINNPTKVLYRSNHPILEANEIYEMNGFKPGIAYPCGAVVVKDKLHVYYGGADSVVCVATASLDTFLDNLKSNKPAYLSNVQVRQVFV